MQFDPTKMPDWKIAELAEEKMKTLDQLAGDMGLAYGELLPVGQKLAKIDYVKILRRLKHARRGNTRCNRNHADSFGEGKPLQLSGWFRVWDD
jgi:formyltetrahydrofolate synthetase